MGTNLRKNIELRPTSYKIIPALQRVLMEKTKGLSLLCNRSILQSLQKLSLIPSEHVIHGFDFIV